jgi:hypothetical protein
MLRLLRGKVETPQPKYSDPLDIRRYTRIEPRETHSAKQMPQACEVAVAPKRVRPSSIPKAPVMPQRPQRMDKTTEINLSEHLYSDAKISVGLLRRALPQRFGKIDARKQDALTGFESPLKYAIG